jgi:hypothetical protein
LSKAEENQQLTLPHVFKKKTVVEEPCLVYEALAEAYDGTSGGSVEL